MGVDRISFALAVLWAACTCWADNLSEGASLLAAKNAWKANLNWTGNNPCDGWDGVRCDNNGRVTYLNLSNKGIIGGIPDEIGNLQYLQTLDLSNLRDAQEPRNVITGNLSVLGGLTDLQSLNLSFNNIRLDTFPAALLKLTNLVAMRVDNNFLSGTLPKEISKLTKLRYLYLANNTLRGPLPGEWGDLVDLEEMSLWNVNLQSPIPSEFGKLVNLRYMNLHDCGLYGGLPAELGYLKYLQNLSLYRNQLTGPIPDSWKNLTSLKSLLLYSNYLTKTLPTWIEDLPNIYNVTLADNLFYGVIPSLKNASLQNLVVTCNFFNGDLPSLPQKLIFNYSGNCFVGSDPQEKIKCSQLYHDCIEFSEEVTAGSCPDCPSDQVLEDKTSCICTMNANSGTSNKYLKVIGSLIGVLVFLLIILVIIWWKIKVKNRFIGSASRYQELSDYFEVPGVQRFTLQEINRATNDFSRDHEIGMGGFGRVFYGIMDNGKKVAIKRSESMIQNSVVFRNEVILLSRLHHRNLVRLVGFCEDCGVQLLVYEYMPNGDLQVLLFKDKSAARLDWLTRLDIAVGIAQGLEYLHSFADPPVIHRDVKPSNVLLDEKMVAKLSDFGLSKAAQDFDFNFSTKPAGTVGYIDPQYVLRQHLTTASDVYSFGMVLLELISGQKSIDNSRIDDHNLVEWVKIRLNTSGIKGIIDPRLGDEYPEQIFQDLVRLGIDCASFNAEDRPSMKAVVTILDGCLWAVSPHLLQDAEDAQSSSNRDVSGYWDTEQGRQPGFTENSDISFAHGSIGNMSMSVLFPR